MELPVNRFKAAISEGRRQIGLWSSLGSPAAMEMLAHSGFNWFVLDTEHAPNELPDVIAQMRVLANCPAEAVVRPAWNDMVLIKRFLDAGAQTLLVPFVQDAGEARQAVRSMRYPPDGVRGVSVAQRANRYGRVADYHARAQDELCLLVQLETRSALDQIEAIADVDGVDGIFIGPSDLAADLGHLANPAHPEVQDAIRSAVDRCRAAGKPAGILTPVEDEARRYLDWGFTFVAVGSEMGLLRKAADALAARFAQ